MPGLRGQALSLRVFVALVGAGGLAIIAVSVGELPEIPWNAYLFGLALLTWVSGRFAIKVPGRPSTISISGVFVFMTLLMFGPAAATLIVAIEGLVVSLRQRDRRVYRAVFNVTEPAISAWVAGMTLLAIARVPVIAAYAHTPLGMLPTLGMAAAFFLVNMTLQSTAIALETGTSPLGFWRDHAVPLALNDYAAASLATLAVGGPTVLNVNALGLVLPLLVLSYAAYREAANRVNEAHRHVEEVERFHEQARLRDEELRQAQKLEALGRLAGGVAHDFNNMLMAISGFGHMLLQGIPEGDDKRNDVDEILKAADRATGLTRQLLAFGRRQVASPRVLDLKQAITDVEKMLQRLLTEDVHLVIDIDQAVGPVKVDPRQIEQILLNLVVNARDAMPEGGTVTVVLSSGAPARTSLPDGGPGRYVRLSVSDTGTGIPASVLPQIFEPFFTTKGEGRGTGLGLATVYAIVQQAGGTIEVESVIDTGTTFHVFLPETGDAVDHGAASATHATRRRGHETVLVVEDEPAVAAFVTEGLRRAGYHVLMATDGVHALDVSGRHQAPIDLVLTDVVMPRMNGRQFVERLAKTRPRTRVLFMSAYSDDAVLARGIETHTVAFLQKPFSIDTLLAKLGDVLPASEADGAPSA